MSLSENQKVKLENMEVQGWTHNHVSLLQMHVSSTFFTQRTAEYILQQHSFSHLFTSKLYHLGAAQYNISPLLFCSWQTWCLSITVKEKRLVSLSFTHFPLAGFFCSGVIKSIYDPPASSSLLSPLGFCHLYLSF